MLSLTRENIWLLRRQLMSITQGTDNVIQFYERLRALHAQNADAITEDQLADQFELGLNSNFQMYMASQSESNPTIESLLETALRLEATALRGGVKGNSPQVKAMTTTQQPVNASHVRPSSTSYGSSIDPNTMPCRNCHNVGHFTRDCQTHCTNCAGRDHKANRCPFPCTNCRRTGHDSHTCRAPEVKCQLPLHPPRQQHRGQPYGARRRDNPHYNNFPATPNNIPLGQGDPEAAPGRGPNVTVILMKSTTLSSLPNLPTIDVQLTHDGKTRLVSCQLDTAGHLNIVTSAFLEPAANTSATSQSPCGSCWM